VCFGMRAVGLCKSRDVEIVQDTGGVFKCWRCVYMLAVCLIREEKRIEVWRGRRDIYTQVPAIWFISCVLLVNEHTTAQPSSCTTTRNLMNEEPLDEI